MARFRKSSRWRRDASASETPAVTVANREEGLLFSVDPLNLFKRSAPLELELGAGTGDFIVECARAVPEHDFLAVELSATAYRLLAIRVAQSALDNLVAMRADARSLVNLFLPDRSVAACHIYFPDPWPKTRHAKHRLFSPSFVAGLKRTLSPGGILYVASDVIDYADYAFAMLEAAGFSRRGDSVPGQRRSRFGRKYEAELRPILAASFAAPRPAPSRRPAVAP